MTTLKLGSSGKPFNGFGFSINRALPTYLAPKLLTDKRQEEFFVANMYAQQLIFNNVLITAVQVSKDDSNRGADVVITTADSEIGVQVTRFTLTGYLHRKNAAVQKAKRIATEVLRYGQVPVPVNVSIYTPDTMVIPAYKKKDEQALSKEIAGLIRSNLDKLKANTKDFINFAVNDERVKKLTPMITLQSVPPGFNSNYAGKGNVFINYDFDNIGFSEKDVEDEANLIFTKKNGGKAEVLLIWVDMAETLGRLSLFIKHLEKSFSPCAFQRVLLYSFHNNKSLFYSEPVSTALIFDRDRVPVANNG